MCVCVFSHFSPVQLFVTLWIVAHQAPLSMGFSRQEYWSGLPFPPPGDLPDPGIRPAFPASPALAGDSLPPSHLGSPVIHGNSWNQITHHKYKRQRPIQCTGPTPRPTAWQSLLLHRNLGQKKSKETYQSSGKPIQPIRVQQSTWRLQSSGRSVWSSHTEWEWGCLCAEELADAHRA